MRVPSRIGSGITISLRGSCKGGAGDFEATSPFAIVERLLNGNAATIHHPIAGKVSADGVGDPLGVA